MMSSGAERVCESTSSSLLGGRARPIHRARAGNEARSAGRPPVSAPRCDAARSGTHVRARVIVAMALDPDALEVSFDWQVASAPGPLERGLRRAERSCPSSRASGRPGAQCPTGEIIPTRRPPAPEKTMSAEAILRTHVRPLAADATLLGRCLDECGACEVTCA